MKIIFENEYEQLYFERLLESIYEDSAKPNDGEKLVDRLSSSLASLFVKVSKAIKEVEKPVSIESTVTTTALSFPELPYFGKKSLE